jgi:hypothetical protein
MGDAGFDGLLAFGAVAHDEDGFAEGGSFFLDAAGIGEEDVGAAHEVDEGDVVEGFEEGDAGDAAEAAVDHFADVGVGVDGVDEFAVAAGGEEEGGVADAVEAGAEAFAAVGGHDDEAFAWWGEGAFVAGEFAAFEFVADEEEGVDAGVAGHVDGLGGDVFVKEVAGGAGGGGEVESGEAGGEDAVEFFGERFGEAACAEAGLDVADGDVAVEGGEGGGEGGGSVALDEEEVGSFEFENGVEGRNDACGEGGKGLAGTHDVEVVVGDHAEDGEDAVEHLAVLGGDADAGLEAGVVLHGEHERTKFNSFGTGTEDEEDFHGALGRRTARGGFTCGGR